MEVARRFFSYFQSMLEEARWVTGLTENWSVSDSKQGGGRRGLLLEPGSPHRTPTLENTMKNLPVSSGSWLPLQPLLTFSQDLIKGLGDYRL